jgi:hypothetical protein
MSRIDNAQLVFDLTNPAQLPAPASQWTGATGNIFVYATNSTLGFSDGQMPLLVF